MSALRDSRYFDPRLFAKTANLPLIARTVVEGLVSGLHQSPYQGASVEFSEFRHYVAGDDPKRIDWKAAAKLDRLYVRRYQEETNLKAYLLVDASGSMGFGEPLTKLQYACYCAAALAYLLIRQRDAAALALFDTAIRRFLAPKSSPQHLADVLAALDGAAPAGETRASRAFHELAERIKRRGLIIVLSDLLDDPGELMSGLAHFRHKKHEVIVFQILDPRETEFPYDGFIEFEDMETGRRMPVQARLTREAARRQTESFLSDIRRRCRELAIEHVALRTTEPLERALLEYLEKRARMG